MAQASMSLNQLDDERMRILEDKTAFRDIADVLPVCMLITRLVDGTILYANTALQDTFAEPLASIVGRSLEFYAYVPPPECKSLLPSEGTQRRAGHNFCLQKVNGDLMWMSSQTIPLVFDGSPALLHCMTDISETLRVRESLDKITQRMNLTLKASKMGTWSWDIKQDNMHWDAQMYAMHGVKADGSIEKQSDTIQLVHVDDRMRISQEILRCFAGDAELDSTYRVMCLNGDLRVLSVRGEVFRNERGEVARMAGICWDVTETHRLTEKLSYQASHDALTDLVNRREFECRLERVLSTAKTNKSEHALCYLDLDQFKLVNDTCGHIAGDQLLREIGQQLKRHTRTRDTLARLGGDEFGLIMENCTLLEARKVTNVLHKAIREMRFEWEGQFFSVKVSIGLVPITEKSENITSLMVAADSACYAAKETGRDRVHEYREKDTVMDYRHGIIQWAVKIEAALETNRFELYSQPIASMSGDTRHLPSYEFLLRMRDEQGRIILPDKFIHAAERFDLASRIDKWVIDNVMIQLDRRRDLLDRVSAFSINLSGGSLKDPGFRQYVMQRLSQDPNIAKKICFEITETSVIENIDKVVEFINALKSIRCRFALDDFGSGISSFGYLKSLPVDTLKIDGVFITDIAKDEISYAMVKSINDIAKVMGKTTVAEYVENAEILKKLDEIGVDYVQGNYIGKPRPIEECISLIMKSQSS